MTVRKASQDTRLTLPNGTGPVLATRRVIVPFAPLLTDPKLRAAQQTELVFGQGFDVHAEQKGWVFGRVRSLLRGHDRLGYVGWVSTRHLGDMEADDTHFVSVLSAPVFSRADLKSHIVMSLPLGARLTVLQVTDEYYQIGSGAYLSRLHARSETEPERSVVAVARRYLGQPYVWGGNGARGVDCSGLLQMSLSACGIDAPRDADLQEQTLGHRVALPERPGDLLFWRGHVGLLATRTRLLHANATHMSVVEEPLNKALRRMEGDGIVLRTVRRL